MSKISQVDQIVNAIAKLGGKGTIQEILNAIDTSKWKTETPYNTVTSLLSKYKNEKFKKEGDFWTNIEDSIYLHCSNGVMVTTIGIKSNGKWTLFGISQVHGFGSADYEKVLFNTTFDDIIPYNSMSGVSYVGVKKDDLWGLIRFRLDPEAAFDSDFFKKAIGKEPIDKNATDSLGREIKMIEEIKYQDINSLKEKYDLDNFDKYDNETTDNECSDFNTKKKREWSEELIEYTKETLSNLEFGTDQKGNVRMKRNDGSFVYITLADAFGKRYNVHHDEVDNVDTYKDISEMIDDGWVID